MPNELLFLRQMLGITADVWIAVTLLAGLLIVLIFRPERVQQWGLFRVACWLLALSVVIPPLLNVLISFMENPNLSSWRSGSFRGESILLYSCVSLVGPLLQGISILFGLLSLIPKRPNSSPLGPAKHPLE
jgi:hypothetical protein